MDAALFCLVFNDAFLKAPKWREIGIKIITCLVKNNGQKLTDAQSGFRAYNRHSLESLIITENGMGASTEILIKAEGKGLVVVEVPVNIGYHENCSTENPVLHGIGVLFTTIKYLCKRALRNQTRNKNNKIFEK
ncbi:unnamed protein product [marine sediment metagenome]|uniref:Uncharacterized protein n=1 Tax=marine sediment metagenome TaxID=412755 RepID=X1HF85_9ZZZZ